MKEGALLFLDSEHYDYFVSKGFDIKRLKSEYTSLTRIQHENNLIMSFHGKCGNLSINRKYHHPVDIIQNSRSAKDTDSNTRCFDIFACHIGAGIQSSDRLRQRLEKKYKENLLEKEYVILNGGNKAISDILGKEEIARTIRDGDDKCPPYIRVLRRMCHCPETIKFLYVVKEINPETKKLENKLVTHKFSALKLTLPKKVTIDKIRAHLLGSMEQFKNEFLSHVGAREKSKVRLKIKKEIERLKYTVLVKEHLTTYGNTTLFIEASRGKIDRMKTYLGTKFEVNSSTEDGETPLFIASCNGHLEIVELLLKKGARHNLGNTYGDTPLYMASQEGYTEVVELLLKQGANPNLCRENGVTPLFMASQNGHTRIVKILLNAGADPDLSRNDQTTPIVMAIFGQHTEVVKLLLSKVNLKMCKWQGKDVEELIERKIKNKEKKEDLLDILYLQTSKVLEPKRDKMYGKRKRSDNDEELPRGKRKRSDNDEELPRGKRKRSDYDEELPHTKRRKPLLRRKRRPSTRASSHTGEQLDREEQMKH